MNWNNANSFLTQLTEAEYREWDLREMLELATVNFQKNMTMLKADEKQEQVKEAITSISSIREKLESGSLKNWEDRISLLSVFEDAILEYKKNNNQPLIWESHSNQLTDLFRQLLKTSDPRTGKAFIQNSYLQVAKVLKENFSCFAETSVDTIVGMLKKEGPKKHKIYISVK